MKAKKQLNKEEIQEIGWVLQAAIEKAAAKVLKKYEGSIHTSFTVDEKELHTRVAIYFK